METLNKPQATIRGYDHPDRLLIAVDCIVFGYVDQQLQVLLVKRHKAPYLGDWALMGGLLYHDESLNDAAGRVLEELTGIDEVYLEQYKAFGAVNRDEAERTISVGYYALVDHEQVDQKLTKEYAAQWKPVYTLPALIFDHDDMVAFALRRLRYRATHEPVAFGLLPERFTLSQLQAVYETIFNTTIDAGNFRRRLRRMNYVEQLDEKDTSTSRKGAYYFRYRPDMYAAAVARGEEFLLKP